MFRFFTFLIFVFALALSAAPEASANRHNIGIYAVQKSVLDARNSYTEADFVLAGDAPRGRGGQVPLDGHYVVSLNLHGFFGFSTALTVAETGGQHRLWVIDNSWRKPERPAGIPQSHFLPARQVSVDYSPTASQKHGLNTHFGPSQHAFASAFTLPIFYPGVVFLVLEEINTERLIIDSEHPVSVSYVDGTGAGVFVTCPGYCTYQVRDNADVELWARPNDDATFSSWTNACSSTEARCELTITTGLRVVANWTDK